MNSRGATTADKQAGINVKIRDFAAEKAAIEVDDESLSVAPQEQIDLSALSSDESSFEENEQLLSQASKLGLVRLSPGQKSENFCRH